jgi:hypothetical protein
MEPNRAQEAATLAFRAALRECVAADLDPLPYEETLADLLAAEVTQAVRDIVVDKRSAGPAFAAQLDSTWVQNIYFADAGYRAAHTLLKQLGVSHALVTTRPENSSLNF